MYIHRQRALAKLGFNSYRDYLASPIWEIIRKEILKRDYAQCQSKYCKTPKTVKQVHHLSYRMAVLLGLDTTALVTLCIPCHEGVEFSKGGRRLSPRPVQGKTKKVLKRARNNQVLVAKAILTRLLALSGEPNLYPIIETEVEKLTNPSKRILQQTLKQYYDQKSN